MKTARHHAKPRAIRLVSRKRGRATFPEKSSQSPSIAPQSEAAEETGDVGDDLDVLRQFHGNAFGVAPADVQEIVVEHEIQGADCSHQTLVPFFLPDFFEYGIA